MWTTGTLTCSNSQNLAMGPLWSTWATICWTSMDAATSTRSPQACWRPCWGTWRWATTGMATPTTTTSTPLTSCKQRIGSYRKLGSKTGWLTLRSLPSSSPRSSTTTTIPEPQITSTSSQTPASPSCTTTGLSWRTTTWLPSSGRCRTTTVSSWATCPWRNSESFDLWWLKWFCTQVSWFVFQLPSQLLLTVQSVTLSVTAHQLKRNLLSFRHVHALLPAEAHEEPGADCCWWRKVGKGDDNIRAHLWISSLDKSRFHLCKVSTAGLWASGGRSSMGCWSPLRPRAGNTLSSE